MTACRTERFAAACRRRPLLLLADARPDDVARGASSRASRRGQHARLREEAAAGRDLACYEDGDDPAGRPQAQQGMLLWRRPGTYAASRTASQLNRSADRNGATWRPAAAQGCRTSFGLRIPAKDVGRAPVPADQTPHAWRSPRMDLGEG